MGGAGSPHSLTASIYIWGKFFAFLLISALVDETGQVQISHPSEADETIVKVQPTGAIARGLSVVWMSLKRLWLCGGVCTLFRIKPQWHRTSSGNPSPLLEGERCIKWEKMCCIPVASPLTEAPRSEPSVSAAQSRKKQRPRS